jgi:hypothetical protein
MSEATMTVLAILIGAISIGISVHSILLTRRTSRILRDYYDRQNQDS